MDKIDQKIKEIIDNVRATNKNGVMELERQKSESLQEFIEKYKIDNVYDVLQFIDTQFKLKLAISEIYGAEIESARKETNESQ